MLIERTIGLPNWVFKILDRLDAEATEIENELLDAALQAELEAAEAKLAEKFGMAAEPETDSISLPTSIPVVTAEAPLGASGHPSSNDAKCAERESAQPNAADFGVRPLSALKADHNTDSNQLPISNPVVTAEARLRASGRPSRNGAARAKSKLMRARAPRAFAPYADQISPQTKITPRARPPPVRTKLKIQTQKSRFCGRPCSHKTVGRDLSCGPTQQTQLTRPHFVQGAPLIHKASRYSLSRTVSMLCQKPLWR